MPAGLKPAVQIEQRISFDGYSYKRYRYKAADNLKANEAREAPLLIGHTVLLIKPPAETGMMEDLVDQAQVGLPTLVVILIGGTLVLVVSLYLLGRTSERTLNKQ